VRAQSRDLPESLLSKVRALLAKAEHQSTPPAEAEAFTAKASELMARYGIERAMVAEADPASDPITDREIVLAPPYALDKRDLLARVAEALRCRVVYRQRWVNGRRQISALVIGFGSDLDRVEMLFTSLLVQAAHALAVEPVPAWENKAAYRRAWLAGYATAVAARLHAAEQHAQNQMDTGSRADDRSVAVVLADRKSQLDRVYDERFGRLGRARRRSLAGSGAGDGYAAGQRADLGGTRVTRPARPALTTVRAPGTR
jgi:Protein of unknown function (DUF2786)